MLKTFTIKRPAVNVYVQWDGTNVAEFEAMTSADWTWMFWGGQPAYVEDGTDLQVWRGENLYATIPLNYWFNGSVWQDLNSLPGDEAIVASAEQLHYVVEED